MTQRALVYPKTAPMHSDFAQEFVARRFGSAVASVLMEVLPRYQRGPKKGLPKGVLHWRKCEKGGWYRTGPSYYDSPTGYVMRPGSHHLRVKLGYDEDSETLLDEAANATDEMRIQALREWAERCA